MTTSEVRIDIETAQFARDQLNYIIIKIYCDLKFFFFKPAIFGVSLCVKIVFCFACKPPSCG